MSSNNSHQYYLVQRLMAGNGSRYGFDGKFELDYMGSSSYEFGAPSRSLCRMREAGDFEIREQSVTRQGVTKCVYFVAPRDGFDAKLTDFPVWFGQEWPPNDERSYFEDIFNETQWFQRSSMMHLVVAWWSLDDDIMWALDKQTAEELLYGLEHPAR